MINKKVLVYLGLPLALLASCVAGDKSAVDAALTSAPATTTNLPGKAPTAVSTWVELGDGGQRLARLISSEASCPKLEADGHTIAAAVRAPVNAAFPFTVCEAVLPSDVKVARWAGRDLPLLAGEPKTIALVGDTGCRMKRVGPIDLIQDCNGVDWPFGRIAQAIAALKPDLIIHVGDYHYRELPCPAGMKVCQGAISGDNWWSWQQDFFAPAEPLLRTAPLIFVRGNHEVCRRSGDGWRRLLDPRPMAASCSDATPPYRVSFGDHHLVVIDAADDANMQPSFDHLQPLTSGYTWWLLHRPFLTAGGDTEAKHHAHLPPAYAKPGALAAIFTGHKHIAQFTSFAGGEPPELITGNGGSLLAPERPTKTKVSVLQAKGQSSQLSSTFGFVTLERAAAERWTVTEHGADGAPVFRCTLAESRKDKSNLACMPPPG